MDENAPYQYFEDVNWGLLRLWNKRKGLRVLASEMWPPPVLQPAVDSLRLLGIEPVGDAPAERRAGLDQRQRKGFPQARAAGDGYGRPEISNRNRHVEKLPARQV